MVCLLAFLSCSDACAHHSNKSRTLTPQASADIAVMDVHPNGKLLLVVDVGTSPYFPCHCDRLAGRKGARKGPFLSFFFFFFFFFFL